MEPSGQGWVQLAEFAVAFGLSAAIGLEREIRQKAAGLRTYTTVGVGAALFTLVSKYGFTDVLQSGTVTLDPSRVAAQIVSGLGFIGAGVIFVHRGSVQGLTTAATIWLTAAVGSAAAAGLPLLAVLATASYFLVAYAVRPLARRLSLLRSVPVHYRITYLQRPGLLPDLFAECARAGYDIAEVRTLSASVPKGAYGDETEHTVEVLLAVVGRGDGDTLTARFVAVDGVVACARPGYGDE
ncbi:MgtC/SapB family protein [Streptomyces sp. Je 1-369]|uniref:MgtC/SapB family protein n=1 Tax=Streptomyces sp. Je 1-369 TaxID=2966192 RepID=UPI002285F64B|nr:MgtC/SapB family protein [Streptomyces sp. Je 1-369]WAL93347.1 MgtC/SapB family protein [Streptomyces sp. Je 1-369]